VASSADVEHVQCQINPTRNGRPF